MKSYETGGAAYHSQAAVTAVVPSNGDSYPSFLFAGPLRYDSGHHLTLVDVEEHIVTGNDVH